MEEIIKVTYQERFMPELDNYLIVYNYPFIGSIHHLFAMTLAGIQGNKNAVGCWRVKNK